MTPEEVFDLLTQKIAPRDGRTVGKVDVAIWHEDISDLDYADACEAVARHFRQAPDTWLKAGHVRAIVKQIREERLANSDLAIPPPPPTGREHEAQYRDALKTIRQHLGDGQPLPFRAIEAGQSEPSEEFRETRDDLAARRKDNALAKARDAHPDGETCDCGALRDPDGICRACQTWTASS
jgi:hypothetical protein